MQQLYVCLSTFDLFKAIEYLHAIKCNGSQMVDFSFRLRAVKEESITTILIIHYYANPKFYLDNLHLSVNINLYVRANS